MPVKDDYEDRMLSEDTRLNFEDIFFTAENISKYKYDATTDKCISQSESDLLREYKINDVFEMRGKHKINYKFIPDLYSDGISVHYDADCISELL